MRSKRRPEGVDWWIWENYTKHERHCPRCLRTWTDEKWYGTRCFKGICEPLKFFPESTPEQTWKRKLPYPMPKAVSLPEEAFKPIKWHYAKPKKEERKAA